VDYLLPEIAGMTSLKHVGDADNPEMALYTRLRKLLADFRREQPIGVSLLGTGPATVMSVSDIA